MEDGIPSGQEMADEFNKLEAEPQNDSPAEPAPVEPAAEIPTVDDSQELKPVPAVAEPQAPDYTAERMQYLNVIAQLQEQIRANQPKAPAPEQPKPLTVDELDRVWKEDPIKAMQLAAMASPEVKALREQVEKFNQAEAERAEQAFANRIHSQEQAVAQKYPDFKPGSPTFTAALNFVRQNQGWLRQVANQDPNFNVVEHAYRQVAFDLLTAQKRAQDQKLVDKRAKAGSVKPGGTAPVTPASGSYARDAASDMANKGEVVPDAWVTNMEKALARYS